MTLINILLFVQIYWVVVKELQESSSINPKTNKPYGLSFPIYTIEDAVRLQKELIDYLGIKKLIVAGGQWVV
ncbi:MAG: hypothetical protein L6V95_06900 [Candidatus Melainabacteria bacterium]|nr:MAG: hypothetical protein L6V95_06900 [Candidatus Melainabacteria bacterium]